MPMRPFFSWPQRLLLSCAVFAALIYGASLNAWAYPGSPSLLASSRFEMFMRDIFSLQSFANAREMKKNNEKIELPLPADTTLPTPTPRISPSLSPTPKFSVSPTPKPTVSPVPSPTAGSEDSVVTAVSSPSASSSLPGPVAISQPEDPSSGSGQVALNLEPAKKLISDAVDALKDSSSVQAFNLGGAVAPYRYGGDRLGPATTRKLYAVAGGAALIGTALVAAFSDRPGRQRRLKNAPHAIRRPSVWLGDSIPWGQKKISFLHK